MSVYTDDIDVIGPDPEVLEKIRLVMNQQWKCKKCNSILDATYEIDHIIPLYKGGDNELANLEALCRNCHGNKTLLDKII